jgi:hypothetical protein
MTRATVNPMDPGPHDKDAPPPGTAIVRPLRHVRAVRERHALRYSNPAEAAASRSARAWAWALGETATAPVTDRETAIPPTRSDIDSEITAADDRRQCGDRENRADAAATILRWLIGDDDHVPVRGQNRGELVGGFGDVVHSPHQIATVLAAAIGSRQRAATDAQDVNGASEDRRLAQRDAEYLDGVVATLAWVLGQQAESPITRARMGELATSDLKAERVHADDVIEQVRHPWMSDRLPPSTYGEGVKLTITWLLGDQATH